MSQPVRSLTKMRFRTVLPSDAEQGPRERGLACRPDLVEAIDERYDHMRLFDAERRPRLLDVKAMQVMTRVDDRQGIARGLAFRPGFAQRDRVAITLVQ